MCEEPILLNLCVKRTEELRVLSYQLGPYTGETRAVYRYEVIRRMATGDVSYTDYRVPMSGSDVGLGDSQALRVERMPLDMTFSRIDMISLSEPGEYRIRGVIHYQYAIGESFDALETVYVIDWTNWVTVAVRPPGENENFFAGPSKVPRASLSEWMFFYYYPHRFLYYPITSEEQWNNQRTRERFSLEHAWRESLSWPKENPWREYLHFTAAAEALADSLCQFINEIENVSEWLTKPTPFRADYVCDVVCSFFTTYPDSWLAPQLLHHYNAFFFFKYGPSLPCIEEKYKEYVQREDPAYAALRSSNGEPEVRRIYRFPPGYAQTIAD